jgi:NAD+ diphosphatase
VAAAAAGFAFVDGALDRADALRDDADALTGAWPRARILLVDAQGQALADDAGALFAPSGQQLGGGPGAAVFLGLRDGQAWFAAAAETVEIDAPRRVDLRSAAGLWPAFESTAFAQARAMLHWRARHRFCGGCGGAVAFQRGGWQGRCAQCGAEHYPRTDPAVIVAVGDGARLLLGRQPGWPPQRYSTLAGFVEPGESLEQTVAREVLEESGVRVRGCRYLASQPWPFPGSLMLGFVAEAEPDPPRVGAELEDARWFDRDEIGHALRDASPPGGLQLSPPLSISRWLIAAWFAGALAGHD